MTAARKGTSREGDIGDGGALASQCRPSRTRRPHLLLAFSSGVLLATLILFAALVWAGHSHRLAASPLRRSLRVTAENSRPPSTNHPVCEMPQAQGIAMSPLALADATGSSSAAPERLIVAARKREDTAWLDVYLSHIPHVVYQMDDPRDILGSQHGVLLDKGHEAMAYLQFIIDYYDRLPAQIAFIHGNRDAWHLKDHVPLLATLRWGEIGFANLRHDNSARDLWWECTTDAQEKGIKWDFDCSWAGNYLTPFNTTPPRYDELHAGNKDAYGDGQELREVWDEVFGSELGELPQALHAPCCAEFVVSRERILAHGLPVYTHLRDWLIATSLDTYRAGRVFEYVWHYLFGEKPVISPTPKCDLVHCDRPVPALHNDGRVYHVDVPHHVHGSR